jgi:anti-sigma regulatory factor (Ser/Thr protein kinase)
MSFTAISEHSMSCLLTDEPVAVSHARELARKALYGWGLSEHADLAELLVSELATNAIRHGARPVRVRVSYAPDGLRVDVHDAGAARPVRRRAAADDEAGRGLNLLGGLVSEYGGCLGVANDREGHGKTVYVVISLKTGLGGAPVDGQPGVLTVGADPCPG